MKWMDEAAALEKSGVAEVPGPESNPAIMAMFEAAGADWVKGDDTPWCGATVAWCIKLAGLALPAEPLRARGWSEYGAKLDKPRPGCIVVLERGANPEQGHVGFVESFTDDALHVLGGNQGDKVSIATFPRSKAVAYRWPDVPVAAAAPAGPIVKSGTLRGTFGFSLAGIGLAFNDYVTWFMGLAASFTQDFGPLKTVFMQAGANTKAMALGTMVFFVCYVLGRTAKRYVGGQS